MTHEGQARPPQRYCRNCGAQARPTDRFCGVCGNRVAPVTPDDPQAIPQPIAAAQGTPTRSVRRSSVLLVVLGIVLVLLVGGGVLAFGSVFKDASPDPAFDLLLPTLKERTTAPIMLPSELPNDFKNVTVDENVSGDRYSVVFLLTPPDDVLQDWYRAQAVGTLTATPETETEENEYFKATETEDVELPDGSNATLSRMEPVSEGGTQGPYWEGKFDRDGYTYVLTIISEAPTKGDVEQALSTMVPVEDR